MTIKDIARLADCSTATVSRVINNEKGVSDAVRAQIKEIIEINGYQPNKSAKGLVEQKTNTILFIYEKAPDENPFFAELIRGAIDEANESHQILLFNMICDSYVSEYFLNSLKNRQIDGVIVASTGLHETRQFARAVTKAGCDLVLINDPIDDLAVPRIYINNEEAGYQATKYLISKGHKRIAHIGGRTSSFPSYSRFEGYYRAMNEAGLSEFADIFTMRDNTNRSEAHQTALRMLRMEQPPTAFFVANDSMAVGVYEAAAELGIKIPDDISIVGYDNVKLAAFVNPPLTTMQQPIYEMGRRSVQLTLSRASNRKSDKVTESIVLPTRLIERGSVKEL